MERERAKTATTRSRAQAGRRPAAGQRGFVLLAVMGVVFFLALVGLAILAMTQTTGNVVVGLASSTKSTRQSDGALEAAVNYYRTNGTPGVSCADPATAPPPDFVPDLTAPGDVIPVRCTDGVAPTPDARVLDLVATRGGTTTGQVRVRITDKADVVNIPVAGYSLEVCDWQIGTDVGTLNVCP